jgi:hypothetical protein
MNTLGKLFLAVSAVLSLTSEAAVVQPEVVTLDSYLKDFHPSIYANLAGRNVDFSKLESAYPSTIHNETAAPAIVLTRELLISPRKECYKTNGYFLENNFVATCVSQDGTLGNGSGLLGITHNPAGTGTLNTPDYLRPGSPFEYFSVSFNNGSPVYTNNNSNGPLISGADNIPTTIAPLYRSAGQEGAVLATSTITQGSNRLKITQKYSLDPNASEIVMRTEMENTGKNSIKNIQFARGLDPDQDYDGYGEFRTVNHIGHTFNYGFGIPNVVVDPDHIAWAGGKNTKLFTALYSVDPVTHKTCISDTWTTVPNNILNAICGVAQVPSPGVIYSDATINIAFKVGALNPGQSRVFSYRYLFGKTAKPRIALPAIVLEPVLLSK